MGSFEDTIQSATDILSDKPLLREVQGTAIVSGDIHGDIDALEEVINLRDDKGAEYLILLGDYVDRGQYQVEVVEKIAQTIQDDDKFIALRGNHEDERVCSRYGFVSQLRRDDHEISPVMEFFSHLPNAARSDKVFMCHGGLPVVEEFDVTEINSFNRDSILQGPEQTQLLWNDPIYDGEENEFDKLPSRRGPGIWKFGVSITDSFFENNNLELLLRAHIAFLEGAKWIQDNRILSLFTSKGGPYHRHKRKVAHLDLSSPASVDIIELNSM